MLRAILSLFLLFLCITSCSSPTPTQTPTPPPSTNDRIDGLINTIYSASGVEKNWEEITSEGLDVETIIYPEEITYKVSLKEDQVIIEHLKTKEVIQLSKMEDLDYSIVPLLYNSENGLGWSGLMLVKCEDSKYYLERSLTAMTDDQLEKVMKELLELFKYNQDSKNA